MKKARVQVPAHTLTIVAGLAMGLVIAWVAGFTTSVPVQAEGGSGACDAKYEQCIRDPKSNKSTCESNWQKCMQKCSASGAVGSCNQDPECQLHCTESATSQGGRTSCCEGGPQHQNSCPNKVDGKCDPKKTEGGEGGKPPELPKPPQGGGGGGEGGQQQQDPCSIYLTSGEYGFRGATTTASTTSAYEECKKNAAGSTSGVSSLLSNWFGSDSVVGDTAGSIGDSVKSAADTLFSFIMGGSATESTTNTDNTGITANPTEVAAVPDGSDVGYVNSGGSSSNNGGSASIGDRVPVGTVTGFGSTGSSDVNTTTGPIVIAINSVMARIKEILGLLF